MADANYIRNGSELLSIYSILNKVKCFRNLKTTTNRSKEIRDTIDFGLFPRRFIFTILNDRFSKLDVLADKLVSSLFDRLAEIDRSRRDSITTTVSSSAISYEISVLDQVSQSKIPKSIYLELDEYFHNSLNFLYYFFIELDWHEPELIEGLTQVDSSYIKSKLSYIDRFLTFRKMLMEMTISSSELNRKVDNNLVRKVSPGNEFKTVRSSLSSPTARGDPMNKKRVRFNDSPNDQVQDDNAKKSRHSIFALDMLIYSLNMFIQRFSDHFIKSISSAAQDSENILAMIKESKKKIRVKQLESMATQINDMNQIYLVILNHLSAIKYLYLNEYVLKILSFKDSERVRTLVKIPRVNTYCERIGIDVERKVIIRLSSRCLELMTKLICTEINLPPIELGAKTKTKSKNELQRSQENYLNFVTSWLRVDDLIFGPNQTRKSIKSADRRRDSSTSKVNQLPKSSIAYDQAKFESSSRILTQMNNLSELMKDLISNISTGMRSKQQVKYFLELIHRGMEMSFDILAPQIKSQLSSARAKESRKSADSDERGRQFGAIVRNIDLIAAKVRCLKLIQIMSSIDLLIVEFAKINYISLVDNGLSNKLIQFTNECNNETGEASASTPKRG